MSAWPTADLAAIAADDELRVAARRADGTLQDPRIVLRVVVDDALYIRSVRGEAGAWYRGAQRSQAGVVDAGGVRAEVTFTPDATHDDAIDRAYHDKYGHGAPVKSHHQPASQGYDASRRAHLALGRLLRPAPHGQGRRASRIVKTRPRG
jgi:hypothetical protein